MLLALQAGWAAAHRPLRWSRVYGLIVLYSASGQDMGTCARAGMRLGMGIVAMLVLAQVNPELPAPHLAVAVSRSASCC